jgi:hypothetical protein
MVKLFRFQSQTDGWQDNLLFLQDSNIGFQAETDGGIVECWVGIRNSTKHPTSIRVQVLKFIIAVLPPKKKSNSQNLIYINHVFLNIFYK